MRLALATNTRLRPVAKRLCELMDEDEVYYFLGTVLHLPGIWRFLKDKPRNYREIELSKLKTASDQYLAALAKEKAMAELYLAGWPPRTADAIEDGRRRYASLVESIATISKLAGERQDVIQTTDIPDLGRKRNHPAPVRGLTIFFARELAARLRSQVGTPLYEEVGLLTTVCLDLPQDLDPEEVREFCRAKRRVIRRKK